MKNAFTQRWLSMVRTSVYSSLPFEEERGETRSRQGIPLRLGPVFGPGPRISWPGIRVTLSLAQEFIAGTRGYSCALHPLPFAIRSPHRGTRKFELTRRGIHIARYASGLLTSGDDGKFLVSGQVDDDIFRTGPIRIQSNRFLKISQIQRKKIEEERRIDKRLIHLILFLFSFSSIYHRLIFESQIVGCTDLIISHCLPRRINRRMQGGNSLF